MYRVDLPADDGGIVERSLIALAARFNSSTVTVDRSVFNPARIWKLPGTWAAKGDHTSDRPHRIAQILWTPDRLDVVSLEQLSRLAGRPTGTPLRSAGNHPRPKATTGSFDLAVWIAQHSLPVEGPSPWRDGLRWVLSQCPWNEAHTNRSAYIVQFANGAIAAGCHHAGCIDKGWHELRDVVEPGWREGQAGGRRVAPPDLPPAVQLAYLRRSRRAGGQ